MVSTGLRDAGYVFFYSHFLFKCCNQVYVNLDDCWQYARDSNGVILPDNSTFPNGIEVIFITTFFISIFQPLATYAHKNGMLFGVYSDAGYYTCAGRPGSLGYETIDANTCEIVNTLFSSYPTRC